MKGVRDPRITKPTREDVENPRPDANRDIIALDRRWFIENPVRDKPISPPSSNYRKYLDPASMRPSPKLGRRERPPEGDYDRRTDYEADLTMLQYRYTKGPEVVNDEMGYGECVTEVFWQPKEDGTLERVWRTSQRTKTGRQFLRLEKKKPE